LNANCDNQTRQTQPRHLWLKDESLEDSANLPDPDIIAAEIVEDLEAALSQFATIAADLKR
jgi:type I restriction enzyme M protein